MLKVREGDREAFRALYERFKGPMMTYLAHIVLDAAAAEELTQEAFLRVFRARETYEPQAKFSTWLWSIGRNAAIDYLRKKKELSASMIDDDGELSSQVDLLPAEDLDAEAQLIDRADRNSVENCFSKLSLQQRDALNLRVSAELSYEEIADTLKLKLPAVKSLIHRAKKSLVDCLQRKASR
jgi:RNA polymerase sigma-70 factor (ECF subfamily)